MRFWNYATGTPWAMTEPSLDTVLTIAKREQDSIEAITERLGRPLEHSHQITMYGQTAVLPVTGPLFRYANLFTAISGATSYEVLARELGQALDPASFSCSTEVTDSGTFVRRSHLSFIHADISSGVESVARLLISSADKQRLK